MKFNSTIFKAILLLLMSILPGISANLQAQFVATPLGGPLTPTTLVQNNLVGQGVTISNVTIGVGSEPGQYGSFTNAGSNLGFSSGVFLCTGLVDSFNNRLTNTLPGFTVDDPSFLCGGLCSPGDTDLDNIVSPFFTEDAAILEFDFIPQSDTVRFRYTFASEEYNEYACSQFNDVFGFFVSGPGVPFQNIALIPGTTIPVAINTINNGTPGISAGLPHNCVAPNGSLAFSSFFRDNTNGAFIEFDGMTVTLEAVIAVTPCSTYHIKLAIADVFDGSFDSGVFLEASSFSSDVVVINSITADGDSTTTEGCDTAQFVLQLSAPVTADSIIYFTVGGTATNGVDYVGITDSVIVLAGDSVALVTIIPIGDALTDGGETVTISVTSGVCVSFTSSAILYIDEDFLVPPPAPTCSVLSGTSVRFTWAAVPGATGYEVSINGGLTWTPPNPGPLTHDVTGLPVGGTATLLIRSVGGVQNCDQNAIDTVVCSGCALTLSLAASSNVSCNGGTNGQATVSAVASFPPVNFIWSVGGQTTATATGLPAGVHTVTATDATNCSSIFAVTITAPAAISITTSSTAITCPGSTNGTVTAAASGGTGAYSFLWDAAAGSQTTQTVQNLAPGNYCLTVTDASACTASACVSVSSTAQNNITASNDTAICAGASTQLNASNAFSYAWSPAAGLSATNIANPIATPATTTTYYVDATIASGANLIVNGDFSAGNVGFSSNYGFSPGDVTPQAVYDIIPNPQISHGAFAPCPDHTTGTGNMMVVNGSTVANQSFWCQTVNVLPATDYIFDAYVNTVVASNPAILQFSVNGILLGAPFNAPNITCVWSQFNSVWNSGINTTATICIVNQNTAGGGNDFAIDDLSFVPICQLRDSVVVTVNPLPAATASNNSPVCTGNPVNFTASGGATYSWQGPNFFASGLQNPTIPSATALNSGSYNVTVTSAQGCSSVTTTNLSINASPTASVTVTNALCNAANNGTATATPASGTAPYTFVWSNGQTTATASGLSAGTYPVTVSDANGCTVSSAATITQPSALTATISAVSVTCFGTNNGSATVVPLGGTAAYSFLWTGGQTTATATALTAGNYVVTVSDANGCSITRNIAVNQPASAVSGAMSSNAVLCFNGSTGSATVNPAGGTPTYSFAWSNGRSTQTNTGLAAGTYTVTITDANSCTFSNSVNVANAPAINISAAALPALCFGTATGSASVNVSGGAGSFSFLWSNGRTTQNITAINAGTYCVTATDANACAVTACATVTQPSALTNSISITNTACSYTSDGALTANPIGGTAPYFYTWSDSRTTQTINNLPVGNYAVTVTDANACSVSGNAAISSPLALTLILSTVDVQCRFGSNGSATATVTGGTPNYSYNWSNGGNSATVNNFSAGFYTLTVSDANGCTINGSVTIGQPASSVLANILSIQNNLCFGAATGSIDADALGGTPNYTFLWSTGATTEDLSGLPAGSYSLTATDVFGCSASTSTVITQPTQLQVATSIVSNFNGAAISCFGAADGIVSVSANGGIAPYTYLWSTTPAQNSTTISALSAGTYTVTVTDANGCNVVRSITLNNPLPLAATEQHVNVFCNGDCDGQIVVNAVSGTGTLGINGYEYRILGPNQVGNVFSANNSFTGLCAGTYTVEVRDGNNCVLPLSITLTQPDPLTASATATAANCNGTATGTASANGAGGTAPYRFVWSNGQTTQNAAGLAAGGYSVTVIDANNCTAVTNVIVTQPTALAATTAFTQPSCFNSTNGSATVTATGGTIPYSYAWSNNSGSSTALGLPAGTHSVTVSDAAGCSLVRNVVITQPAVITINITGSNLNCAGNGSGSVTAAIAGGTAPYTYLWNNGQTTATATGLNVGTYSVFVTDSLGCQINGQITLSQPNPVIAALVSTTNVSCNGGANGTATITATGGTSPYTFNWPNGQTATTATGLAAGSYTATVSDANGCSSTVTMSITQPAALQVAQMTTTPVSCKGGSNGTASAFINGGSSPYTFVWSNGGSGQSINGLAAGTYNISVTDGNGCVANSTVIVTEPASFLVGTINTSAALCQGAASGQLAAIVSGGTLPASGDYFYTWSNGANTAIVPNVTAGTYSVTTTDANGCSISLSANVGQAGNINLTVLTTDDADCLGANDGSATIAASGGTGILVYQWSNGQALPTATGLSAGTYTVTVTDANGCAQSSSITVGEGSAVNLTTAQTNVSCFGQSNGSLNVTSTGVSLYLWSTGQVGNPLSNLPAGQYMVTVADNRGCTVTETYNVTQPEQLLGNIEIQSPILCHDSLTGNLLAAATGGTAGYSYVWSNGVTGDSNINLAAGTYSLTVTDANGCTSVEQQPLVNPTALALAVNMVDVRCTGDRNGRIIVSGSGGTTVLGAYEYSIDSINWQGGDLFPNLGADTFTVYVRDANGCMTAETAVIEAAEPFFITMFTPLDTTIEYGDTLNLAAMLNDTSGATINWTDVNANTVFDSSNYSIFVTPANQTVYNFSAVSPLGCQADTTVNINVTKPRRAGAPLGFTPNSDGHNDNFFIQGDEKVTKIAVFRVYDRWGELVFEALNVAPNDVAAGWDGNFKGKPMNSGVYSWYAEVVFIDGHAEGLQGDITLLR